jgi:prepilin-type N-terminal cleavage/methylation domain-containing protein
MRKSAGKRLKAEGSAGRLIGLAVRCRSVVTRSRGMTLPELLISLTILSMMSVVLAGMSNAVNSAWSYTKGVEETDLQARAAIERIEYMVSQTGVYRVAGQPTRLGMTVVSRPVGKFSVPDVLVLWTGGRSGGMAANGLLNRLPTVGELLIYTCDAATPSQLNEVAFPGQSAAFDFAASDLGTQVGNLLTSSAAESIPLCDHLRLSSVTTSGGTGSSPSGGEPSSPYGPASMPGGSTSGGTSGSPTKSSAVTQTVSQVRFALTQTPSDSELASATPQTAGWMQLKWPQGTFGNRSGLRQATLQMELQVEPDGIVRASDTVTAIPFFGSASQRYVYEP